MATIWCMPTDRSTGRSIRMEGHGFSIRECQRPETPLHISRHLLRELIVSGIWLRSSHEESWAWKHKQMQYLYYAGELPTGRMCRQWAGIGKSCDNWHSAHWKVLGWKMKWQMRCNTTWAMRQSPRLPALLWIPRSDIAQTRAEIGQSFDYWHTAHWKVLGRKMK